MGSRGGSFDLLDGRGKLVPMFAKFVLRVDAGIIVSAKWNCAVVRAGRNNRWRAIHSCHNPLMSRLRYMVIFSLLSHNNELFVAFACS